MKPEICCIGHITLDKIITPHHTVYMPGGTAFYFAHAMSRLDHSAFQLVTSLAQSEMKAVDDIRAKGIDVRVIPSRKSVYFENKYSENQNERTQRVLAKADPFRIETFADIDAKIFHLGTLLADDFSLETLKALADRGVVSADAQGYLREVRGQQVFPVDWTEKIEALKYISILKVNELEMETLTGSADPKTAAKILAGWGVKEVVITLGDKGSVIYADGEYHNVPAYRPERVFDATGCGDTYMTGYLYMRNRGASYVDAGKFAAAMCTIKLADSGPFAGTEQQVLEVINSQ